MRTRLLIFVLVVTTLFALPAAFASGPAMGGDLQAEMDGRTLHFPALKTDIAADVRGDLATVTVTQTFANPTDRPLHARYLFPLNHDAAVFEMVMEVGAERIRAQIQETQQAEATFAQAKSQGKAAALLREHRPNMFTQDVANLMPGLPITTRLRYVQTVPKVDGAYELVVPLVVGPRFQPSSAGRPPEEVAEPEATARSGPWQLDVLPAYPPVHGVNLPPAIEPERVAIDVRIDGGMPVHAVESRTHALDARPSSAHVWTAQLAKRRVIDNRDFVLRYRLGGANTAAGLLAYRDARGGFFSLLIEPPS
ncbi:MAG: VIT domain-containing protein, partial [Betaproteobacteria bacterium]